MYLFHTIITYLSSHIQKTIFSSPTIVGKSCSKSVKAASKMAGPKGSGMPATKPEEPACDLGTIVDVAIANGSFNTLVAAVTAAELGGTLSSDGPFTVFAPTDDAFAALPEGTVEGLLEDIPALTSILTYHVVAGKVESTDLVNGPVTTVNGADVEINLDDGVKVNDSNVIIPDVQACNGVIHVIDAVLLPPTPEAAPCPSEDGTGTIVDVAVGNGSFGTLVAAVTAADLVETLSGDGPFTVFGK